MLLLGSSVPGNLDTLLDPWLGVTQTASTGGNKACQDDLNHEPVYRWFTGGMFNQELWYHGGQLLECSENMCNVRGCQLSTQVYLIWLPLPGVTHSIVSCVICLNVWQLAV